MTEQERMKAGYMWMDDAENMEMQARARELVTRFNALPADANRERMEMNREMFGSCGKNVWIVPPLKFTIGKHITIGEGCYFNQGTTLIDDWKIEIGDHCLFGPNVTLCTTGHPVSPSHRGDGMYSFPIRLGNNVLAPLAMYTGRSRNGTTSTISGTTVLTNSRRGRRKR